MGRFSRIGVSFGVQIGLKVSVTIETRVPAELHGSLHENRVTANSVELSLNVKRMQVSQVYCAPQAETTSPASINRSRMKD